MRTSFVILLIIFIIFLFSNCRKSDETIPSDDKMRILILATDPELKKFWKDALSPDDVFFVGDVKILLQTINQERFDALIVTNFGAPTGVNAINWPDMAGEILDQVPVKRNYKTIMLTGFIDERVEDACKRNNFILIPAPCSVAVLKSILTKP